ncbi:hypothetical protein BGZ99_009775 [Dissophora globulifera]|uniref:Uncharacterized protein n=1 Tax=Dissophora globulifera TaxID=979702 RepID=A0A9P6UMY1_9FUNG|nr:hypothetical protein BGZ99_009775 [Dissophora globulifera]
MLIGGVVASNKDTSGTFSAQGLLDHLSGLPVVPVFLSIIHFLQNVCFDIGFLDTLATNPHPPPPCIDKGPDIPNVGGVLGGLLGGSGTPNPAPNTGGIGGILGSLLGGIFGGGGDKSGSAPSPTPTNGGIGGFLGGIFGGGNKSPPTSTSAPPDKATPQPTTGGGIGGFFDSIFGGGHKTITTSAPPTAALTTSFGNSGTTAIAKPTATTTTAAGGIAGFFDSIFGGGRKTTTTSAPPIATLTTSSLGNGKVVTTTKPTTTTTAAVGGIASFFDSLFGGGRKSTTTLKSTTIASEATSTPPFQGRPTNAIAAPTTSTIFATSSTLTTSTLPKPTTSNAPVRGGIAGFFDRLFGWNKKNSVVATTNVTKPTLTKVAPEDRRGSPGAIFDGGSGGRIATDSSPKPTPTSATTTTIRQPAVVLNVSAVEANESSTARSEKVTPPPSKAKDAFTASPVTTKDRNTVVTFTEQPHYTAIPTLLTSAMTPALSTARGRSSFSGDSGGALGSGRKDSPVTAINPTHPTNPQTIAAALPTTHSAESGILGNSIGVISTSAVGASTGMKRSSTTIGSIPPFPTNVSFTHDKSDGLASIKKSSDVQRTSTLVVGSTPATLLSTGQVDSEKDRIMKTPSFRPTKALLTPSALEILTRTETVNPKQTAGNGGVSGSPHSGHPLAGVNGNEKNDEKAPQDSSLYQDKDSLSGTTSNIGRVARSIQIQKRYSEKIIQQRHEDL